MPAGYIRIVNLPEGYAVQVPLSPTIRAFDSNNAILGVAGEFTICDTSGTTPRTYYLPIATKIGQLCALKAVITEKGAELTVLPSFDTDNGYQQVLFAGLKGQGTGAMVMGTYPGEVAIFASGQSLANNKQLDWYLVGYHGGDKPN